MRCGSREAGPPDRLHRAGPGRFAASGARHWGPQEWPDLPALPWPHLRRIMGSIQSAASAGAGMVQGSCLDLHPS